ncbi:IS3 family transposase [Mycobacterium noviomagense]|uniref:IS3 family transposase n=1 Tax=Mycobacterium noviomagense TaxID=459858 RepID=UPI0013D02537|nr:IS3 family transposase [Mycobacterium noviomagense]
MATRKRHTPEQIVRKLMTADRLLAEGKDTAAVCRDLGVSEATYHRWRNQFGGLKAEDAKRLKDLERENTTLKRLLADAELEKAALKEIAKGKLLGPERRRAAVDHLQHVLGVSERFACRVAGQHRSTQRHEPASTTPADPDAALRAWVRAWAKEHPRRGFRPAYHDARDEGWPVNHKKFQRLWREEGLRVPQRRRRKRHGTSTAPQVSADAPDQVWAADFQFDVTTDGRPIKTVSIIDEHTRECLGDMVERNITGEDLICELERIAAHRGTYPAVLRCDNGPEFACAAMANWAANHIGLYFIPPGEPWRNGYVESFHSRIRNECLNINSFWSLAHARVVISDWKHEYNHHRRHSALGYQPPARYAASCTHR